MIDAALREKLTAIGQDHVLRFYDGLDPAGRVKLAKQLAALDLDDIAELAESHVRNKPPTPLPTDIQPVQAYPREPDAQRRRVRAPALPDRRAPRAGPEGAQPAQGLQEGLQGVASSAPRTARPAVRRSRERGV